MLTTTVILYDTRPWYVINIMCESYENNQWQYIYDITLVNQPVYHQEHLSIR